jgi:CheY-like chemotaxis protein
VEQIACAAKRLEIPTVLLLPAGDQDETAHIAKLDVVRCVPKPVKPSELHQALLGAIGLETARPRPDRRDDGQREAKPLHILLAEDCLVNQEVAIGLLELRGHSIEIANNGREAVKLIKEKPFDVVLMDVEMPEMDGLEATRSIRQWEATNDQYTPIIAMTAHAIRGYHKTCEEAGMDDYISKPVDAGKLYEIVESAGRKKPAVD